MIRLLTISLALLMLSACSLLVPATEPSRKEVRRTERATRKLDRLVAKYPELRSITPMVPISISTPTLTGTIIQPLLVPIAMPGDGETIILPGEPYPVPADLQPFSIAFSDAQLDARVSYTGQNFELDYTIHPIQVDTTVQLDKPLIQGTRYITRPLTWWQSFWMRSGQIGWIVLALIFIWSRIRNKLNLL